MRMISNTEMCSRRGHLNPSFISDEEIAREEDTSAIVEEADQFLEIHPQHQVENELSEDEVEQESC